MAVFRPLKVYAFDPTAGRLHGNHMTVQVPYEDLRPGPRGRLVEVIDYDSSNNRYYDPVDLDDDDLLLQNGLTPTETDPRFHQQMVYAVASKTIDNFRIALGRDIVWDRRRKGGTRDAGRPLRIFPHGVQAANAYYTPDLHALVFGYFSASGDDVGENLPGQTVFSCLSHDIIAHETTHALVHDIRRYFMEPTGLDTLAFHEAFADIVALFQHFTFRDALVDFLLRSGGVLHRAQIPARVASADVTAAIQAEEPGKNLLIDLARQFGEAMGMRAALRGALSSPRDATALDRVMEPHERGAILVAAIFDAFFSVYSVRMADLLRIARPATPGEGLSRDLAERLAAEAAKTARQFVAMCIRALDYCPPVDITFGDFLRALVTADIDTVPDDDRGYRELIIGAFRARGIRPSDATSYSEDALAWETPERRGRKLVCSGLNLNPLQRSSPAVMTQNARVLSAFGAAHRRELHLKPGRGVQAYSFHPVLRVTPDGELKQQVVVELLQQEQRSPGGKGTPSLTYRGGTTLVLDGEGAVRCAVYKRLASTTRWEAQRDFWDQWTSSAAGLFKGTSGRPFKADFALIHQGL